MNRITKLFVAVAITVGAAAPAALAQCTTCPTPTVAFSQPAVQTVASPSAVQTVAYQPTVAYEPYTGWYPGRFFDRLRLRRWSRNAGATVSTASPTPYVTAYAPLQRTAQTAFYQPVTSVDSCTGCTQTSFRPVTAQTVTPTTALRPVLMRPVVAMRPVMQTSFTPVDTGCNPCADGYSSTPSYTTPGGTTTSDSGIFGPTTPQPRLDDGPAPTPAESRYRGDSQDGNEVEITDPNQPDDSSTGYEAPALLDPQRDQVTQRPSVEVRHAVYRSAARTANVGGNRQPTSTQRDEAPLNVDGWHSAP